MTIETALKIMLVALAAFGFYHLLMALVIAESTTRKDDE